MCTESRWIQVKCSLGYKIPQQTLGLSKYYKRFFSCNVLEIKETINYFLIKKKKNIEFDVINFSGRNIALNKGKGMFELMRVLSIDGSR